MAQTTLVIGGTGRLGEPVARALSAGGHDVRVLSRNEAAARRKFTGHFQVMQGDVLDVSSLGQAIEGCSGVHISIDGRGDWEVERRGARNIARVAAERGVRRITLISGQAHARRTPGSR